MKDTVNAKLVPLAAQLIATVYDHGPDAVADVLRRVKDHQRDDLLVLLAAMVNPDARPSDLLAWTTAGPVVSRDREPRQEKTEGKVRKSRRLPREHGTERGYRQHISRKDMPQCARCKAAHKAREAGRYLQRKATENGAAGALEKVS